MEKRIGSLIVASFMAFMACGGDDSTTDGAGGGEEVASSDGRSGTGGSSGNEGGDRGIAGQAPGADSGSARSISSYGEWIVFCSGRDPCPSDLCKEDCGGSGSSCHLECVPQACSRVAAVHCPVDACDLIIDCAGQERCWPTSYGEEPRQCGEIGYWGQEVECCDGLALRCGGWDRLTLACDPVMDTADGQGFIPVCLACGDGTCGDYEESCNCSEDCGPLML